jgi:hypothetical protein
MPCSVLVFQHTFSGTTYICAVRSGVRGWILVDYGTDASTVIQNALNALTSGGKIFIKDGTYIINTTLLPKSSVTIEGETPSGSILKAKNGLNAPVLKVDASSGNVYDVEIRNLCVDGNRSNQTAGDGIYAKVGSGYELRRITLENVQIKNAWGYGVYLDNAGQSNEALRLPVLRHLWIYSCGGGVRLSSVNIAELHDIVIEGMQSNDYQGVRVDSGCGALRFSDVQVYNYSRIGKGFDLYSLTYAELINCGVYLADSGFEISQSEDQLIALTNCIARDINKAGFILNPGTDSSYGAIVLTACSAEECSRNPAHEYMGFWIRCKNVQLIGCIAEDPISPPNMYAFQLDAICDETVRIIGCTFKNMYGMFTPASGGTALFIGNSGYVTENSGTATILSGNTSVTFAHGLAGTPTVVTLGATHAEVADAIWSADATNITITVPNPVTANRNISWYAEYKP